MDDLTSFLEHPLDKNLYKPKKYVKKKKPPLRVLVTDAGTKIAYNLLYSICSGKVFPDDREIILHLINSRGSINHKAVIMELAECGFPCYKDAVVSSNPAVAFKKVDIIIVICTYEEMPGRVVTGAFIHQMVKTRQIVKNAEDYASKNCKIIFTGPSTKAVTILLGIFSRFDTKIPTENFSGVTHLDTVISKAVLAAKLKTTTDKIKNLIIWSATYPDVRHATVHMYPPGDNGFWEKKDIPVGDALQDDSWLYTTFALAIYRRVMSPDILKFGKAVAQSTAHHLKVLFSGSTNYEELLSMAVLVPPGNPYGVPKGIGFSFPVQTVKGVWRIEEDVPASVPAYLNMMRAVFNMSHGVMVNSIIKVVSLMLDYEMTQKQVIRFYSKYAMDDVIETRPWTTKYFVTPSLAEGVDRAPREASRSSRKSILWDDDVPLIKSKPEGIKSTIRFSSEAPKDSTKSSFLSYANEEILSVFNKKSSIGRTRSDLFPPGNHKRQLRM